MNEQLPARPNDPWDDGHPRPQIGSDEVARTESFPTEQFPTEQFPTRQFPTERFPAEGSPSERFPTERSRAEHLPDQQYGRPTTPQGGYPAEPGQARYPDRRPTGEYDPYPRYPGSHRQDQRYPGAYPQDPRFAEPHYPGPRFGQPEPLAHEGGLAYGNAPAAPYGPMDQFIPQHLNVPNPYAQAPYPFGYPPQAMQQTVFVNNTGRRRVNHVLHLVLTVLTAGLWLPVWIILAIANS